jgi:uncharacterized Zn-finger protein
MSDPVSAAFYNSDLDYSKHNQGLDFLSFHSPGDILAPHPDLFESDLDSSLAAFDQVQLQLLTVDSNDAYSFLRSDTPTCGPPSSFTVSSASESYDAASNYNLPTSPYSSTDYSFPIDLDMEFQKFRVDAVSDYGLATTVDPNSFGALPPTPPRSPEVAASAPPKPYRSSFSDYGSYSSDYRLAFSPTVAPSSLSPLPPQHPSSVPNRFAGESDEARADPRKKYRCTTCPRAFARAYNLKTHMATHDPNRLKPHVCPHRSCHRSFSRKHDLARHQVSLHGAQKADKDHRAFHPVVLKAQSIGVGNAARGWCEGCGKGWVGRARTCGCDT